MKKFILFLILITASVYGQQWELTSVEPSYVTKFAVKTNNDIWAAGANNELYKYSISEGIWQIKEINGWWPDIKQKELIVNNKGVLLALPTSEAGVLSLSEESSNWETIPGTESLNSFESIYGDTILFRGAISRNGGTSWENCYTITKIGRSIVGRNIILFMQTEIGSVISPYNYFLVSLEDSSLTQISSYAHKRAAEFNTEYMNNNVPDSVLITFPEDSEWTTSYRYTLDDNGNILLYRIGMKQIYRLINNKWELIYYASPEEDIKGINFLYGNYAFSDSCVYKINYDSLFSFSKLPGIWPMQIATFGGKVFEQSGSLYINSYGGTREFVQYDLSKNQFSSFRKGIPGQSIQTMKTSKNGIVYAKDDKEYIYKSINSGASWYNLGPYGSAINEQLAVTDSIIISVGKGIYNYSTDGGKSWMKESEPGITYIHIASDGKNIIRTKHKHMTGGDQLEISYNNGRTFSFIDSVYDVNESNYSSANPKRYYIYTSNGTHVLRTYYNNVLFYDNAGNVDTSISPVDIYNFTSFGEIYFGRTDAGIVKLDRSQISGNHMFKASAAPEWTFTGLEGKKILSLTSDSLGVIYAGTEDGTYFSADSGATWEVYGTVVSGNLKKTSSTGLSQVKALLVNGSELFAAANEGLYKTKTYGAIGIKEEPNVTVTGFKLAQNYPNPFNPETNISFTLPKAGHIKLTVYNALGQEVGQLVNMELGQGSYNYKFDGSKLSSGVYIYSLEAGTFRTAKKMMLIK